MSLVRDDLLDRTVRTADGAGPGAPRGKLLVSEPKLDEDVAAGRGHPGHPQTTQRAGDETHALAYTADDANLVLAAELEALGKLGDLLEQDEALARRLVGVVDGRRQALDALSQMDQAR